LVVHPNPIFELFEQNRLQFHGSLQQLVGNGNAMGIARQIVENMFGLAEGWLGKDDPASAMFKRCYMNIYLYLLAFCLLPLAGMICAVVILATERRVGPANAVPVSGLR
jgi:hypothetical protein